MFVGIVIIGVVAASCCIRLCSTFATGVKVALSVALLLCYAGSGIAEATGSPTPLVSIKSALEPASGVHASRLTVRGTVTRVSERIVLQDQTGALEVAAHDLPVLEVGDEVEATGRPVMQGSTRLLADAVVKTLWRSSPPPPLALSADEAANGERNEMLVQVEGKLLRTVDDANAIRLQLEAGHQFFSADLSGVGAISDADRRRIVELPVNSIIRLTGVLQVRQQQYSPAAGSFSLLLRDAMDVDVVKGPPWGTPAHIVGLVLALVALCGLMQFAHVRSMRRQFVAILAERSRISRDVHDTLAQGFAGIALQLEVVRGDLKRSPEQAESHLQTAAGMVRHCRAEAHRSISALRAFARPAPLNQMLEELVTAMTGGAAVEVHLQLESLSRTPDQRAAEQLFRICQEAVANAVQHAQSRHITVALKESEESLCLVVHDDGCGFNVDRTGRHQAEHFGITGMQERAAHLGACFHLTSKPGSTKVEVSVPHSASAGPRGWQFRHRHRSVSMLQEN